MGQEKIDETIAWLDNSQAATKDEYESQQKELEGVANPIMMEFYQKTGGGAGGAPGGFPPAPRGVPQIEVTFDVDANGIINVSAVEKGTGKSNKIVITNDKGRLSKEDIERMLAEAEKYKEEDEAEGARVSAKNGLESYAYSLRNTLSDPKVDEKIEAADKDTLKAEIDKVVEWLDDNQQAAKEEYEDKQKELEGVANPIMMKFYGAGGEGAPGGAPGGFPGAGGPGGAPGQGGDDGPTVEEVD